MQTQVKDKTTLINHFHLDKGPLTGTAEESNVQTGFPSHLQRKHATHLQFVWQMSTFMLLRCFSQPGI